MRGFVCVCVSLRDQRSVSKVGLRPILILQSMPLADSENSPLLVTFQKPCKLASWLQQSLSDAWPACGQEANYVFLCLYVLFPLFSPCWFEMGSIITGHSCSLFFQAKTQMQLSQLFSGTLFPFCLVAAPLRKVFLKKGSLFPRVTEQLNN